MKKLIMNRLKLMSLKVLSIISFIISSLWGFSQTDTIRIDLNQISINYKTCECILFGGCRSYSYPIPSNWKKADSLFIGNKDTIYFSLVENGKVKIEGLKKPEGEVMGKIKFYNKNSELSKIEIWEHVYLKNEKNLASWSDAEHWAKQMVYQKKVLVKETIRSIIYDEKKGYANKTEVIYYKHGNKMRKRIKIQY